METNNPRITVTSPLLPPLKELIPCLEDIWTRKWITNNGHYHRELEKALCDYLGVPFISVFTNGTLPIMTALQALGTTGEVITTPYSFVATTHSIMWNGLEPVFVDVDPATGNMCPSLIEAAITERTTAIMPVHVYGTPCDVDRIQDIAERYSLKVIYDAAHAFGVRKDGKSILNDGDLSTLSFHATKTYNTVEGGALICHDAEMKKKIDQLKNFGISGEQEVIAAGINGKMDELRSAYGLLNLNYVDEAIARRKSVSIRYREAFKDVQGLSMPKEQTGVEYNYSYFPVFIDQNVYGCSRDSLYETLKEHGILARRYFYPLISNFPVYNRLPSADPAHLPVANKMANEVLCLPIHHELSGEDISKVLDIVIRSRNSDAIRSYS